MANRERFQNPVVGDDLTLRLFSYNANAPTNFTSVSKVEIYFLDITQASPSNPEGRSLVQTISSGDITNDGVGTYHVSVSVDSLKYVIGTYIDVWTVQAQSEETEATIENRFQVFPNLWFTNTVPIIYDFNFVFRPNKIRTGSKRFLVIEVTPNVPNTSDLGRYYENLAIVSPISISIEQACGDCLPAETDLRLIVDNDPVDLREKTNGYYFLDTTTYDPGIYNVWFQLSLGGNIYVSEKSQLQIF